MEKEIWKPLMFKDESFEELYEVSNLGKVRKSTNQIRKYQEIKISVVTGYATFYVRLANGRRSLKYLHRVLAELFLEKEKPNQQVVIHLDYNKLNNDLRNLKWADRNEQMLHQQHNPNIIHKGRKYGYKIKPEDVRTIFRLIQEEGRSKAEVARKFNISPTQIRRILSRKNWDDVSLH
jgi:hypothetical protein